MIGLFFSRALIVVFGYVYPAYECYKTVELNKADINQLRFWCQYWILVALLSVFERVGDVLVSWLPMYSETKLAFYVYLWFPKTKGTTYVYETFFRPYLAAHETEIDRNLLQMRTRAADMMVLGWQKATSYGQARFFEILHFVASQSQAPREHTVQHTAPSSPTSAPEPASDQAQQLVPSTVPASSQHSASPQPLQAGRAPSPRKIQMQEQSTVSSTLPTSPAKTQSSESNPISSSPPIDGTVQVDAANGAAATDDSKAEPQVHFIDDAIRVTRARLRRRADVAVGSSQHQQ